MLILILEPLSRFLIRTQIVQSLGADLNGQYQVLAGISLAYINVIKEARGFLIRCPSPHPCRRMLVIWSPCRITTLG